MLSFGELHRLGVECTSSYCAGLLRYMLTTGFDVLEATAPDKLDRRRRGKNEDFDAQSAAHVAFAKQRTVTPRSRDGMVESRRVLKVCRKTAVQARRVALRIIQTTIVCAPESLRDLLRNMTRIQLMRTLAAWRPDLSGYDAAEFVSDLRMACVTPHVARKSRYSVIDGRTTRHQGYALSIKRRKRVEEAFGCIAQTGYRGVERVRSRFILTMAANNLARLPRLLGA